MIRKQSDRRFHRAGTLATFPALALLGSSLLGFGATEPAAARNPVQETVGERVGNTDNYRGELGVMMARVREELITLPNYDVFDWLEAEITPEGTVVLDGFVVEPTTMEHAVMRAGSIEGVTDVTSNINVLPLSPSDDRIRLAVYEAIYGPNSPLYRYAGRILPPVHILVDRGRVTLKGSVSNNVDRQYIDAQANSIPGVFDVENDIELEVEA